MFPSINTNVRTAVTRGPAVRPACRGTAWPRRGLIRVGAEFRIRSLVAGDPRTIYGPLFRPDKSAPAAPQKKTEGEKQQADRPRFRRIIINEDVIEGEIAIGIGQ